MRETFWGRFARGVVLYERLSVALLADVELWCLREESHVPLWGYDEGYIPAQKTWQLRVARTDWARGTSLDLSTSFEVWLREGTLAGGGPEGKYAIRFPSCLLTELQSRPHEALRSIFTIVHDGKDVTLSLE